MTATDEEQPVTTTDEADSPPPEPVTDPPATVTVMVAGGRDGLQGVQVRNPATGIVHRPGDTVEVSAAVARDWRANGWVVDVSADQAERDPAPPPTAPTRQPRQRPGKK